MTDGEFLLSVLKDGGPHSQAEILRRSFEERGCGLTVHSRAADLRRKGYEIRVRTDRTKTRGNAFVYTLVAAPTEAEDSPPSVSADAGAAPAAVQLPLLPMVEAPPWA